ncbi:hypothetical protein MPSEU_000399600 [Mayamaea pseudoterrestris]|nr:hypothetical protein MPSEU_000399600 [Mayamaea pseudoterrestris]
MTVSNVSEAKGWTLGANSRLLFPVAALVLLTGGSLFGFKSECDANSAASPTIRKTTTAVKLSTDVTSSADSYNAKSFDLAFRESLGFFDDISESDWMQLRNSYHAEDIFFRPPSGPTDPDPSELPQHIKAMFEEPGDSKTSMAVWMFANVDPIFNCPHRRRVGGRGDGPKWTCDPHRLQKRNDCLVYSVGSAGNYMFEDGLNEIVGNKHCEIHVFDPNPKLARPDDVETKNIHYHAWGLKSSYTAQNGHNRWETYSLAEVQQRLGHVGRRIDIFKIDCEGCEWTSYKDWINESVDIRQILIEVHAANGREAAGVKLNDFFQEFFNKGFVPFAKEPNTLPAAQPAGTMYEYAFVKLAPSFFEKQLVINK